ncbi:MAG TPA: hypothetical protein V6D30_02395 [Leptolyngbyaceae cyanobacterium]
MSNWIKLDEQWQERSKQMFQRCVNELDMTKAQQAWSIACQSEKRRLEWKSLCLQEEGKVSASTAVDNKRLLFTSNSCAFE